MRITDLSSHLAAENSCAVYTGTFDPAHVGHAKVIEEAFASESQPASLVVVPHNWNLKKNPVALAKRVDWLIKTIEEFNPYIKAKIRVCADEELAGDKNRFDVICAEHHSRILRVVGDDKAKVIANSATKGIIVVPRSLVSSSTLIREAVKNDDLETLRKLVALKVFEEIISESWY